MRFHCGYSVKFEANIRIHASCQKKQKVEEEKRENIIKVVLYLRIYPHINYIPFFKKQDPLCLFSSEHNLVKIENKKSNR